jgi:hypothetical protein
MFNKSDFKVLFTLTFIWGIITLMDAIGYSVFDKVTAYNIDVIYFWVWFCVIILTIWWAYLNRK